MGPMVYKVSGLGYSGKGLGKALTRDLASARWRFFSLAHCSGCRLLGTVVHDGYDDGDDDDHDKHSAKS